MEVTCDGNADGVQDENPCLDSSGETIQPSDGASVPSPEKSTRSPKKSQTNAKDSEPVVVNQSVDMGLTAYLNHLPLLEANVDVPIESIEHFDIRAKGSDKARIQAYAQSMIDGIEPPNVILMRERIKEKFDSILRMADGNHRVQSALLAGRTTIRADIYEGGINECIDIGLAANQHGNSLKPQDILHAIAMKLGKDGKTEDINISDLSRKTGISRQTIRKYLNQANIGYTGMTRKIKLPKSDEEKAQELADKVVHMVAESNPLVIQLVFQGLSPYTRSNVLNDLRSDFTDDTASM